MMKNFLLIIYSFILICHPSTTVGSERSTQSDKTITPSGWRILHNGIDRGLLIPSIHAEFKGYKFDSKIVQDWVKQVDVVFVEYDVVDPISQASLLDAFKALPPSAPHLDVQRTTSVAAKLEGFGYGRDVVTHFGKLSFYLLTDLLEGAACLRGKNSKNGFDVQAIEAAAKEGKPVKNLESASILTSAIKSVGNEAWVEKLDKLIDYDFIRKCPQLSTNIMSGLFERFQQRKFSELCNEQRNANVILWGDARVFDNFTNSNLRNKEFARRINEQLATSERSLFMIGAAHFGCSNDVRVLLKALNKDIEFIPLD
jgi:uncharacterized protein YbaP (TraB family)